MEPTDPVGWLKRGVGNILILADLLWPGQPLRIVHDRKQTEGDFKKKTFHAHFLGTSRIF